jgi:hypothetical protein
MLLVGRGTFRSQLLPRKLCLLEADLHFWGRLTDAVDKGTESASGHTRGRHRKVT